MSPSATQKITLAKGLNMGLRKAMEDDPKVLLMGEDVGKLGGVFRITDGLQKDFGEDRVIDSPAGRVRHRRHRGRPGDARLPAGRGDPVRRLRLPGLRPDRLPGRQDPLPHPGPGQDADGHPDPVRRRHRRGRAPQRVAGGAVRAHPRPQGRRLLQPGRRLLDDPAGDRLRRPGDLPRAQAAVPRRQGRARRRPCTPEPLFTSRVVRAGQRRHAARLRPDGEDRAEGRRGRRRARAARSRSSTCARSRRSTWARCSTPCAAPAAPWSSTRRTSTSAWAPRSPPGSPSSASTPSRRRCCASAASTPLPGVADRGGLPARPRPGPRRRRPHVWSSEMPEYQSCPTSARA